MDSWETSGKAPVSKNKWEGEDEEEDVLDSWDMEEPEEQVVVAKEVAKEPAGKKKRKDKAEEEAVEEKPLSPQDQLAEKLRRQKLQEEADLVLAKEMLGVSSAGALETKQDFDRYLAEIDCRVNACVKNPEYAQFAEQVVTSLCLNLSAIDIKRIHNIVGNLHIEKMKMEKGDKGKKNKGKAKAKLRIDEETDYNEFSAYTTDDFDDFI